jgi:hypothetical protein
MTGWGFTPSMPSFKIPFGQGFREIEVLQIPSYPNRGRHIGGAKPRERGQIWEYSYFQDRFYQHFNKAKKRKKYPSIS